MKEFLKDAKERKLALMMDPNDYDEFILIKILRHEKDDLYNIRLATGKNIISVSSKFIEIKEVK
tara:strand:+ start:788 stop:979 length:192 start_codon:yes stop_codon:yes gene_type:complete